MGFKIQPFVPLALVGMDAVWGGCDGLDACERMTFEAGFSQAIRQPAASAAEGAPAPADKSLVDQVARRALQAAGLASEAHNRVRIILLVAGRGLGSQYWDWADLVVDLTVHANPLASAVELAGQIFQQNRADAVVFAAGSDLQNLPDDIQLDQNRAVMGFDWEARGWRLGSGAGAVVWMEGERAAREGRQIYAVLQGAAASHGRAGGENGQDPSQALLPVAPALQEVRECCQSALEMAGVTPEIVGYLEVYASGQDALDGIEIAGMVHAYRRPDQDLSTALGSVQTNTGYLGAATGLAGLIRTALCLYHRSIPGVPDWTKPRLPALWRGAPFYVPGESRPWFVKSAGPIRIAGLNVLGLHGAFAHFILEESPGQPALDSQVLAKGGFSLFPLAGDHVQDLTRQLIELRQTLLHAVDLNELAASCYETASRNGQPALSLAIVGHSPDEVLREIDLALNALPEAVKNETEWQTPLGSYFTPRPAGRMGDVAFVYPGAFNSYPGVGKDLFRLFPDLYQHGDSVSSDLGQVFRERMLYPRSLSAISKEEMAALEAALLSDPIAMLISGTALSIMYTHILRETFAIRAEAAFGYSLGENSMLYATGMWTQGDAAAARLERSETFRNRLAGPQQAIREYWNLSPNQNEAGGQPLWTNYLVMAEPEKVQDALAAEPRVYLTHINTPRQVVIGGDPQSCQRVLSKLHSSSLRAPFDYALHCEVMRSEFGALAELHNWPVERDPELRMYSAADYRQIELTQPEVSQKLAHMLTTALDFPRLIRKVYADGARVFIELGAGSNCARWIDETLKGSPHLALSMNRRGTDDYHTLVRTLSRLFSHQAPMDLSVLYRAVSEKVRK